MRRILRWLRGPWVADSPAPDLSWLDRKDGLDTRRERWTYAPPSPTRYDAEWPDVLAAEAPGGDLAAMAAPWPGMARDALGTYAEPVVLIKTDLTEFRAQMGAIARDLAAVADPPKPRGRHRQTDPLDLILADLRDLGGQP